MIKLLSHIIINVRLLLLKRKLNKKLKEKNQRIEDGNIDKKA